MSKFAEWLVGLVKEAFTALFTLLLDLVIEAFDLLLTALSAIMAAVPLPQFATQGIGSLLANIPPEVWYFAGPLKIGECFAVLGAAFSFRMLRKILTFFQW